MSQQIEEIENAVKENMRDAKDAYDDGNYDLCIYYLDLAKDEIHHLIDVSAEQGVQLTAAGVESDGENQDSGGN